MGQLNKLIAISRLVSRIRKLKRESPASAVPELKKLLQDPARSRKIIVPLLLALRGFGPAAAVVLPLVEKLSQPGETEKVRRLASSVIKTIRDGKKAERGEP